MVATISECDIIGCDGKVDDACFGEVDKFWRFSQILVQHQRFGLTSGYLGYVVKITPVKAYILIPKGSIIQWEHDFL